MRPTPVAPAVAGRAAGGAPAALAVAVVTVALSACSGAPEEESAQDQRSASSPSASPSPSGDSGASDVAALFGAELLPRDDGSFGTDRWSPLPGEPASAFSVSFPEGSVSPSSEREEGTPPGGMQVFADRADGPLDEAYLRYRLRFPEGFQPAKGGKLPGLFGGTEVSGGEDPDGTDGFSTRLMWRSDLAGELYLYAPDESGTSIGRGDWTWPTGRWLCVEQHVALNQPGQPDGAVTVWVDEQQVLEVDDLLFRTVPDLQIEGLFFSTFFGGDDRTWASPADQHIDFADLAVSPQRIGCGT